MLLYRICNEEEYNEINNSHSFESIGKEYK